MQHGLSTFVRLVRALLGPTAIADGKTDLGHVLVILGIQVKSTQDGATFNVCPEKAAKWAAQINEAVESLHLDSGTAQKLAGRLNFATQHLFHKLGRAMIKPIYAQKTTGSGRVGPRLLEALKWWLMVLRHNVTEHRAWLQSESKVCRMFVDAASIPAWLAAVLFIDGHVIYTDAKPTRQILGQLAARNDKQITSLVGSMLVHLCAMCDGLEGCVQEIISILLAVSTFADLLRGRKVVLYSDNKGTPAFAWCGW